MAVSKEQTFERIKRNCKVLPNGCWEWQRFLHPKPRNYGGTGWNGKSWHTHRLTYVVAKGDIPPGMLVMHSCDYPPCCNPDHLSLGTHLQNMSDCRAKGRYYYANLTHCKRGHEFNEANTYIIKTPGEAFGLRCCKVCQLGRQRVKSGWPEHFAFREIKVPRGYTIDFQTGEFISTRHRNKAPGKTVLPQR